jgi:DNA-binding response OmpR family regulator
MSKPVALIVDDEPDILELIEITLDRTGSSANIDLS